MSGDDPTASGEAAEAVPLPPHQVATGAHAIVAPPAPYPTGQVLPGFVAPPAPARSVPWPDLRRDGIAVVGLLLALIFPWNGHFSATDGPAALVAPTFLFIVAAAVGVIASAVVSLGWTTAAPGGSALRVARTAAAAPLALLGVGVVGFDVIVSIIHVGQWIPHNPGVGLGVWGAAAAFVAAAAPRGYDLVSAKDESRRRGTPVALAWVAVAAALFGTVRLLVGAVISLANDDGSVLFGGIRQTAATVVAGPLTVLPAIAATLVIAFGLGRRDPSLRSTALAVALGLVVGGGVVFGTDGTPEVFGFGYYGLGLLVAAAVASLGSPSSAGQDATTPGRVLLRAGRHAAVWIAVVSVAELVAVLGWTLGSTGRVGGTVFAVVLCVAAAVLAGIAAVIWWPADPRALPNRAVVLPLLGISASMTFVRYLVEDEGYWSRPATITLAIVVTALATIVALVSAPSVRAEYAAARPARADGPYGANPYAPQAHPAPVPLAGPANGAAPSPASPYQTSGAHPIASAQAADPTVVGPQPGAATAAAAEATVVAPGPGLPAEATTVAPSDAGAVSPNGGAGAREPVVSTHPSSGAHPIMFPYPPPGVPGRTNGMAIAALVTSLLLPPLGIVFGHIGLSQIKRRREEGRGLAVAGLVIGYLYTIAAVAAVIAVAVVVNQVAGDLAAYDDYDSGYSTSTTRYPTSTRSTTTQRSTPGYDPTAQTILDAGVGSCVNRVVGADLGGGISEVTVDTATCGSGYSTHKVVERTDDIADCGSKPWVRTSSDTTATGWIVLCLRAD